MCAQEARYTPLCGLLRPYPLYPPGVAHSSRLGRFLSSGLTPGRSP